MSAFRHDRIPAPPAAALKGYPGWPSFDDEQCAAVEAVLRSGRVNAWTGDEVRRFESEYAASLGIEHAVAVSNGTVAIELALHALDIGPGDEVIVPSRTFLATASSVAMLGATPVFADIDPISGNLSAATVEPLINSRTRAVIAVHVAGWPCELDELVDLTRRHGLSLIEDCAQAHGAEFRGRAVGVWGDIGCFSFCQDKILTTGGEGGLVVTRNADYFKRIWSRKDHGKDQDALNRPHVGLFKWLHESIGTNARLTEMQAAIGRVQLRRLPEWVGSRRRNAVTFDRMLSGISGLRLEIPPDHIRHSYYKYYAFVDASSLRPDWNRDRIGLELQRLGVPCGSGSCCEIYLEKAMHPFAPRERWTVARQLSETSLMLLVHPTLETSHIESMARQIRNVLSLATAESCRAAA